MGIADELANGQNQTTNGNANGKEKKPAPKVWLNPGIETTDREGNPIHIGLPIGIGVDTMDPVKVRGRNEDFRALQTQKNELLEAIQAMGEQLSPGEEKTINLVCKIRRVDEAPEAVDTDDQFKSALGKLKLVG